MTTAGPARGNSRVIEAHTGENGAAAHHRARLLHWAELAFLVLCYSRMIYTFAPVLLKNPINPLLVVSEGLVILFVVFRRGPIELSTRPGDWLLGFVGTAAPLLIQPASGVGGPQMLERLAFGLVVFGTIFSVWGKLTLRRSFGIVAANRGVIATGPYRFVRHPIYAGYIVNYAGSLIANPNLLNGGIYAMCVALMVMRIVAEERVLLHDADYVGLARRVRFRVIPGIF